MIKLILKVKVKQSKDKQLLDWGLGEGVILSQEVKLNELKQDLINESVECIIEEV